MEVDSERVWTPKSHRTVKVSFQGTCFGVPWLEGGGWTARSSDTSSPFCVALVSS